MALLLRSIEYRCACCIGEGMSAKSWWRRIKGVGRASYFCRSSDLFEIFLEAWARVQYPVHGCMSSRGRPGGVSGFILIGKSGSWQNG